MAAATAAAEDVPAIVSASDDAPAATETGTDAEAAAPPESPDATEVIAAAGVDTADSAAAPDRGEIATGGSGSGGGGSAPEPSVGGPIPNLTSSPPDVEVPSGVADVSGERSGHSRRSEARVEQSAEISLFWEPPDIHVSA